MEPSEIEQNVNKIKELLKSEDFDVVNNGLELLKKIDEPEVYEKLLEGCGVNEEGYLVNEKKELSAYLVCVLSSLSDGPKAKEIKEKLTILNLSNDRNLRDLDVLYNFTNITSLDLSYCYSLTNLDGLTKLTKLNDLNLWVSQSLANIDGLANLANLTTLYICTPDHQEVDMENYEGFELPSGLSNLKNLTEVDIESTLIKNVDDLANLTNLTVLDLEGCTKITNLDGLVNLTALTDFNFCYGRSLTDISGLANLTNLTNLDLSLCEEVTDLSYLANLTNLNDLVLIDCGVWYPDEIINVDFLANLTNLKKLDLSGCISIQIKPDNYSFEEKYEEGGESVILKDEELTAYLKKIKEQL
jgi:internalin A